MVESRVQSPSFVLSFLLHVCSYGTSNLVTRSHPGLVMKHSSNLGDFSLSFLRNCYTFVSLHDSDHEGVVRIFVALSCEL